MKTQFLVSIAVLVLFLPLDSQARRTKHQGIRATQEFLGGLSKQSKPKEHSGGGTFVGNGGDVVACRDGNGDLISVELLDVYEVREEYQLSPELPDGVSIDEAISIFVKRAEVHDILLPYDQLTDLKDFFSEVNWHEGKHLEDIPDSYHLSYPKGCKVEQIVIQVIPDNKLQKRYTINMDLWAALPPSEQALLVLHELLYKYKIRLSKAFGGVFINSRDVRLMVGLIAADRVEGYFEDQYEYLDFLTSDLWILGEHLSLTRLHDH